MHFKESLWNYLSKLPHAINQEAGAHVLLCTDPVACRLLLTRPYVKKMRKLVGSDITLEWIEANLQTLSLFGNSDSYVILQAENISKDCLNKLVAKETFEQERSLLLIFEKDGKLRKDLLKNKDILHHYEVIPPKFWEMEKYLVFLAKVMGVGLTRESIEYLTESLPAEGTAYFNAINMLRLYLPDDSKMIDLNLTKELIAPSALATFDLATNISTKNFSTFFQTLCEGQYDFDSYRQLFRFLQGHLIKLADPSYANKKTKLSRYDNEIKKYATDWDHFEVCRFLQLFGRLEIMAKQKSSQLQRLLKNHYLQQSYRSA